MLLNVLWRGAVKASCESDSLNTLPLQGNQHGILDILLFHCSMTFIDPVLTHYAPHWEAVLQLHK